jgi:hypothetical protein
MKQAFSKQSLEQAFGTESALGIVYVDGDGKAHTPDELDAYYTKHGEVMPQAMESQFPDGSDAVRCTNYAVQVGKRHAESTQIFGFLNEENPDCEIVQRSLHPGGHDFAIVDQRWLVDPWVRLVRSAYQEIVYDLHDATDAVLVRSRYGSREKWKHMTGAEEVFGIPASVS